MSKAEATLWEHLEELVIRLRRAILALLLATIVAPFLPNPLALLSGEGYSPLMLAVHYFIRNYVVPDDVTVGGKTIRINLIASDPFIGIKLTLYTMLLIGVIVAGPYMAYEIYAFIRPALYPHEERFLKLGALASSLLFLLGALVALFVLLPVTYRVMFILTYLLAGELVAYADYSEVFKATLLITLASGIAFQAPLIIFLLVYYDIIKVSLFGKTMRYLLVLSAITAAVLTPDPSGIGMLILLVPYYSLVALAVVLANWLKARKMRGYSA